MLIINDTLGTYGGSITLIERLCKWAVTRKESIKIYCNDVSNKEIITKLNMLGVTVECFDTYNENDLLKHIKNDSIAEDVQIVNFALNNYLSIEVVKKKNRLKFVNLIYSIHPATFYKGTGVKNGFLKDLILKRYKKTIQRINQNKAIVFMDEDNIVSTEKYYGFKFKSPTKISALPMICVPMNYVTLEKKINHSYQNKTILTSCRADFPFKGYVFGLIDDFSQLSSKYQNIRLCIVCSGDADSVMSVKEKILSCKEDVRSKIEFHDWVKYEDLLQLINNSYIYVGMGTGVLDAAIKYVPAIAVRYNTYENIADCILCDKPNYVVAEESCESKAIILMDKLLSLDRETYGAISRRCFEEVAKIYDIESFFEYIKSIEKGESYLTNLDVWVHSMNTILNSLKKKEQYDVRNIQYEEGD